jgi:Transglutaminase-like superfamily
MKQQRRQARNFSRRLLPVAEAFINLVAARLRLRTTHIRTIVTKLDHRPAPSLPPDPDNIVGEVRWAVQAAVRHSPIEFTCFPQALAGHRMLRRRGVPSEIHYGVAHSESRELEAHVWLIARGQPVVGTVAAERFTEIAVFGKSDTDPISSNIGTNQLDIHSIRRPSP